MKVQIELLSIKGLKAHEKTEPRKVQKLIQAFRQGEKLRNPIVVARDVMVILDGHHRVAAFSELGVQTIPALVVDYQSETISVSLRRKELLSSLIKESVIRHALSHDLFPIKTTKHVFRHYSLLHTNI